VAKSGVVVCKACEMTGTPRSITPGSMGMEVLLWLCFLLPGMLYSTYRISKRYKGCAHCGSADIVPIESPAGQNILRAQLQS
jgi:hypothetical protein